MNTQPRKFSMYNKNNTDKLVEKLILKMNRVDNIKQLPQDATLEQVIDAINKITNRSSKFN